MMRRVTLLSIFLIGLVGLTALFHTASLEARSSSTTGKLALWDEMGGRVSAVAKAGDFAYIGMGRKLVVLNVAAPAQPVIVGQSAVLPEIIHKLTLHNQYAYAEVDGDLAIFDLSDVTYPRLVTIYPTPGFIQDMLISGTSLYVTEAEALLNSPKEYGGMRILDISSPTMPIEIGHFDPGEAVSGIAKQGQLLYLSHISGSWRTSVVDISNPANPTEVHAFQAGSVVIDLAIANNHLYLADIDNGLVIYDLATPQMPTFVNELNGLFAIGVSTNGSILYVEEPNTVYLYDVTNPSSPLFLDVYADKSTLGEPEVAAVGDYMYLAYDSAGFQIVDVSDPTAVTKISEYDLLSDIGRIALDGDHAYIPEGLDGINILALNETGRPSIVGHYPRMTFFDDIAAKEGYMYTIDTMTQELLVIDATTPTNPALVTQHFLGEFIHQMVVEGDYAYAVGSSLNIVDISDPQNSNLLTSWFPGGGEQIAVSATEAFIGDSNVLRIVDVANPLSPMIITTVPMTDNIVALETMNNYLYVAVMGAGLHVLDVSDTTSPTPVDFIPLPVGFFSNLLAHESNMYFNHNGLSLLDATNPASPQLVSQYPLPAAADIAARGSKIYIPRGHYGLSILFLATHETYMPLMTVNQP